MIKAADADSPSFLFTDKASVSENQIAIEIDANKLEPRDYLVSVFNPPPGGGVSEETPLKAS